MLYVFWFLHQTSMMLTVNFIIHKQTQLLCTNIKFPEYRNSKYRIFLAMATYSSNWFGFFFLLCYFSFLCNFLYKREKAGKTFWFAYDTFYLLVWKYNAYFFWEFFWTYYLSRYTYLPQMGAKLLDYKKEQSFLCDISIQTKHTPQNKIKTSKDKICGNWCKFI